MNRVLMAVRNLAIPMIVFVAVYFLSMRPAVAGKDDTPMRQVKETVEKILGILDDPQYAAKEKADIKKQLIISIVKDRFDFKEMSQRTLASNWKRINAAEQNTFVELFSKLLEDTYIKKIEQYSGEEVIYGASEVRGDRAVVETNVIRNRIETPLVYRLKRDSGDKWFVYDVVIEGVSLVSNYRSQFSGVIEKEKFSGLVARLEKKISELED